MDQSYEVPGPTTRPWNNISTDEVRWRGDRITRFAVGGRPPWPRAGIVRCVTRSSSLLLHDARDGRILVSTRLERSWANVSAGYRSIRNSVAAMCQALTAAPRAPISARSCDRSSPARSARVLRPEPVPSCSGILARNRAGCAHEHKTPVRIRDTRIARERRHCATGPRWRRRLRREKDLSAEPARSQTPPWLPQTHVDGRWRAGAGASPRQGPQAAFGLEAGRRPSPRVARRAAADDRTGAAGARRRGACGRAMTINTLKRSAQFKRVRGGARYAGPLFIIEGRRRPIDDPASLEHDASGARFGFTITRKVGSAVVRNRVRRRLREALRTLGPAHVRPDYDYVVVASRAAHDYPFAGLQDALREAFERLHRHVDGGQQRAGSGRHKAKGRRGTARPLHDGMPETGQSPRSSDGLQPSSEADESNSGNGSGRR